MLVERAGFYLLLVLTTVAFLAIILPFYSPIFWAVVLAIIFFPVHARIERLLIQRHNLAAAASVVICLVVVIIPAYLVIASLLREANHLLRQIDRGDIDLPALFLALQNALPAFARDLLKDINLAHSADLAERFSDLVMRGGGFFGGHMLSIGQNTLHFFVSFGVMLYLLFFLFRDGRSLVAMIRQTLPLHKDYSRRFLVKFASVVRATIRGNVIIAALQGTIGGIIFWLLGLQPALLWGVLMAFFSLVPMVGAGVVWVPAAIYLAVMGFWAKAAILVTVGVLVIGLVDNLLRPPLVGKETKLPDYVVLITTIGGISLLGADGFVIGPVIAAMFVAAWQIFMEERGREDDTNNP